MLLCFLILILTECIISSFIRFLLDWLVELSFPRLPLFSFCVYKCLCVYVRVKSFGDNKFMAVPTALDPCFMRIRGKICLSILCLLVTKVNLTMVPRLAFLEYTAWRIRCLYNHIYCSLLFFTYIFFLLFLGSEICYSGWRRKTH